jgi:hypothetical protein
MKKILLFISILFPFLAHAQRPVQGMQSFSFGISGLQNLGINTGASRTGTILYKHYKTDSMAYRFSAALNINTSTSSLEDKGQGIRTTTINNSATVNIAPGFQNSLGGNTRLEPYYGIDFLLGYTFVNSSIIRNEVTNADTTFDPNDERGDYNETETRFGRPVRVGIIPLIGANYFITNNISIGAEFSYGLVATFAQNGTRTFRNRIAGVDQEENTVDISASTTGFNAGAAGSGLITMGIYF